LFNVKKAKGQTATIYMPCQYT